MDPEPMLTTSMNNRLLQFRRRKTEEEQFVKESYELSGTRNRCLLDEDDSSSKKRCLAFRREEGVLVQSPTETVVDNRIFDEEEQRLIRQRFSGGKEPNSSSDDEETEDDECGNDDVSDEPLRLECSEQQWNSSKQRVSSEEREEVDKYGNVVVFAEPLRWVVSSEQPKRQRSKPSSSKRSRGKREEEDVFLKPWLDSVGSKRPRFEGPSPDEVAALILLKLSRDTSTPTQTQTLQLSRDTSPQMQTQPVKVTETQTQNQTVFPCSVCGKQFTSYQALGGHKASHKIKPIQPLVENVDNGEMKRHKVMPPSGKIHKCLICDQVFPTGQALGGHKRRHFEGVLGANRGNHEEGGNRGIHEGIVVLNSGSENGRDKSPSNGSVVINVCDRMQNREQSFRGLIDLNKSPSREFDDDNGSGSGGDAEEIASTALSL